MFLTHQKNIYVIRQLYIICLITQKDICIYIYLMIFFSFLYQRLVSKNYSLAQAAFVNKVFLEKSHTYLFIYYLWLLWHYNVRVEYLQRDTMALKSKIFTSWPFPEYICWLCPMSSLISSLIYLFCILKVLNFKNIIKFGLFPFNLLQNERCFCEYINVGNFNIFIVNFSLQLYKVSLSLFYYFWFKFYLVRHQYFDHCFICMCLIYL